MSTYDAHIMPQVLLDPVVTQVRTRARLVHKQLTSTQDPLKLARLHGQLDAFLVDLLDAVRVAAGRVSRDADIPPMQVNRELIQHMIEDDDTEAHRAA